MKKALVIIALALFVGGISAPVIAANSSNFARIELQEEDPKKKEKKSETTEKKAESTEKSSDCSKSCEGKKESSDCSKK